MQTSPFCSTWSIFYAWPMFRILFTSERRSSHPCYRISQYKLDEHSHLLWLYCVQAETGYQIFAYLMHDLLHTGYRISWRSIKENKERANQGIWKLSSIHVFN
jgi:hypothetical protein